jgi:hypothetical protein
MGATNGGNQWGQPMGATNGGNQWGQPQGLPLHFTFIRHQIS